MHHSRTHSILAAIAILIVLSPSVRAQQNQWDIQIELAKDQYVLHEPIWLDITLTNMSPDTLRTHGLIQPNHRQFYIELEDSSGNRLEHSGWHFLVAPTPGDLLLQPGQHDFGSFDVVELFRFAEDHASGRSDMIMRFPYIPEGHYTIRARYEGAISRELAFTVVEPSGEAKKALELMELASSVWRRDNTAASAQAFSNVVETFPNSPYAEKCFYLSMLYSPEIWNGLIQGAYDKRQLKRAMLEHYPNSGDARDWISALTRDLDPQAKGDFLNEVAESHPDTRAAKYARSMLDRMTEQKAGE